MDPITTRALRPTRMLGWLLPVVGWMMGGACDAVEPVPLYPVGGGNTAAAATFWSGSGNVTWQALGVSDVPGDYSGGSPLEYDFVGSPGNSGLYWASTSAYVFFRMRVAVDDVTTVNGWSGSHFLVIDVVGQGNSGIDYGFGWDGANAANVLEHGLEMQVPDATSFATWSVAKMDDMDGSMKEKTGVDINGTSSTGGYRTTDGYVRTTGLQSTTDLGTTTLVDFAVSWSYLETYVPVLFNNRNWLVAAAAVNGANDHTTFNEVMGVTGLAGAVSGPAAWSAIPEPTNALVGLLVAAGLLRRRRG